MQVAGALLQASGGFVWPCQLAWGRAQGTHSQLLCALDHWLGAQLSRTSVWESCRARINQCLMCLFDTPSAGMKQFLFLIRRPRMRNLLWATYCSAPEAAFCRMRSQSDQHRERILDMNFWSHRGASAAHSDAMQHFSSEGITAGATAEGPSLRIRGVPTK